MLLHLRNNFFPIGLHHLCIDLRYLLCDLHHVQSLLIVFHTTQSLGDDNDGFEVVLLQFDSLLTVVDRILIFM